jgi:predicted GIY-YIG superfamily endonuclease
MSDQYYEAEMSASAIANLHSFKDLMKLSSIKNFFKFISLEDFKRFNELNYLPHYRVHGTKAFKSTEVIDWIKSDLVSKKDGQRLTTKFYCYPQASKKPKNVPSELLGIKSELRDLQSAPPSVYFLINDNRVVYVGKSVNVYSRIKDHEKDKKFDRTLYMIVDVNNLAEVERKYINALLPKYNNDQITKNLKEKTDIETGLRTFSKVNLYTQLTSK